MPLSTRFIVSLAAVLLVGAGCASTSSVSLEEYSEPKAEIRAAEELGAEDDPQAKKYLEMARKKMENAREQIDAGNAEAGNRLLMEATADAELARAHAEERNLRAKVQNVEKELEELERETGGN